MNQPRMAGDIAGDLILACCAQPDADHSERFAKLKDPEWQELLHLATHTRTAPLVNRALEHASVSIPHAIGEALNELARWHGLTALRQALGLKETLRVLEANRLRPILLKGSALAYQIYPDPALRPLRDVDLLLPASEAQSAERILLATPGFERVRGVGNYGIEHGHQLPEIRHLESGLVIELHHRINARGWDEEPRLVASLFANARISAILGTAARLPSPDDNFLHLVEHATRHHLFANGPLVMADLYFLHDAGGLSDLASLVSRARQLGLERALTLLAVISRAYGARWPEGVSGHTTSIDPEQVEIACCAMLSDRDETQRQDMLRRLSSRSQGSTGFVDALVRALRPDPQELGKLAGTSARSIWRWLGYPRWLLRKGALYLSARQSSADSALAMRRQALANWLEKG